MPRPDQARGLRGPLSVMGLQWLELYVSGQVQEPFWWQPVCSPRAGGDVKRWGSPTGGLELWEGLSGPLSSCVLGSSQ